MFFKIEKINKGITIFTVIVILLLIVSSSTQAQDLDISGTYGYQFGGKFAAREGDVNIKDSENYFVAVDIGLPFREGTQLELSYTRQNTRVDLKRWPTGVTEPLFDATVEYLQIGGLQLVDLGNGRVYPFGVLTVGATHFNPKSALYNSVWKFSAILGIGTKIFFNDRLGLRLQARLLMPFQWGGGSLWCGTGGCSVGVGSSTTILQGDVSGGLVLKLR
jgi:hypothetical protein